MLNQSFSNEDGKWVKGIPNGVINNLARCRRDCQGELSSYEAADMLKITMKQIEELLDRVGVCWETFNYHEILEEVKNEKS